MTQDVRIRGITSVSCICRYLHVAPRLEAVSTAGWEVFKCQLLSGKTLGPLFHKARSNRAGFQQKKRVGYISCDGCCKLVYFSNMAIHFTCCFDKGLLCRTPECRIFYMFFLHACRLVHCNLSNMVPGHKPKEYLLLTLILINNAIEHLLSKFSFSFLTNERVCITWMQLPFNLNGKRKYNHQRLLPNEQAPQPRHAANSRRNASAHSVQQPTTLSSHSLSQFFIALRTTGP